MLSNLSIILMLYSPRFPSNITFQGAAVKLLHFSRVVCQVLALFSFFFDFLMSTFQNYTKTVIRIRLGKYSPIFTSPSANNC